MSSYFRTILALFDSPFDLWIIHLQTDRMTDTMSACSYFTAGTEYKRCYVTSKVGSR